MKFLSPLTRWFRTTRPRNARTAPRARPRVEELETRLVPVRFVTPLAGVPYQDWTISNYVDLDPTSGVRRDWAGNTGSAAYTYDGHNGIDFTLPSFAAQDVGVPVFAAAAGEVVAVADGNADRNIVQGPCTGLACYGNFVRIKHEDGTLTDYAHLRRDSVAVRVGQKVNAGDVIGLVGSSGNSDFPHLHFAVWENGQLVEPYLRPSEFWHRPLEYAGNRSGVLDFGTTDDDPSVPDSTNWRELKERPPERDTFRVGQTVHFWATYYGVKTGDVLDFRWFRDGVEIPGPFAPGVLSSDFRQFAFRIDKQVVNAAGEWRVELDHNGVVLAEKKFHVVPSAAAESPGWIEFGAPQYHVTENGFDALISAVRRGGSRGRVSVTVTFQGVTAGPNDFVGGSQTLWFADGAVEPEQLLFLSLKQDSHWEMPETLTMTLGSPTGGVGIAGCTTATATIHDDGDLVKFITPLGGTPFVDWHINNYVDLDDGPGKMDFKGFTGDEAYTYDGHDALDIALAHFAAQDAGIPVFAAADGRVIEAVDGDPADRNTAGSDRTGNYVKIDHGNGLVTEYFHLRHNSVAVAVGQIVRAGHVLGLVGSSGNSDSSHLHFAVKQNGATVKTYLDPDRWWQDPLPYTADRPGVKDFGTSDHSPTDDELRERPREIDVFVASPGLRVHFWAYVHGIDDRSGTHTGPEDQFNYRWERRVNGNWVPFFNTPPIVYNQHGGWERTSRLVGPLAGEWRVSLRINGVTAAQKAFRVVARPQDVPVGRFSFSAPIYRTTENSPFAEIRVRRLGGWRDQADVFLELQNGSARRGADYANVSRLLRFAQGEVEKKISIPVLNDFVPEFGEDVVLVLRDPTNGASLGRRSANLVIHDSAEPPSVTRDGGPWGVLGRNVSAPTGRDDFTLRRLGGEVLLDAVYRPQSPASGPNEVYQWRFGAGSIEIDGRGGDDTLTIDFHAANPFHLVDVTFTGGHDSDRIRALADLNFELTDSTGELFLPGVDGGRVPINGVEVADLVGGPAANRFTIDWSGSSFLDGRGGGDTYQVTHVGPGGQVNDHGANGNDQLTIAGTDGTVAWRMGSDFVDVADRLLFYAGLEDLTVNTGEAFNQVFIESTAPRTRTRVNTGGGNDAVNVAWGALRPGPAGPAYVRTVPLVTLFGGDFDSDTLIVEDRVNPFNDAYTLTANAILAQGASEPVPAMIGHFGFSDVGLRLGGGASTITVQGTGQGIRTTVNAGAGDDRFEVRNTLVAEMSSLQGPLFLHGSTHNVGDRLRVTDVAIPGGPYTVTPTSVTRWDIAPIDYHTIEGVVAGGQNVFVVNTTADTADAAPGDGFARDSLGRVSLRAALREANALPGSDVILFGIPGAGVRTIAVVNPLPKITDPVTIDATSQPGYAGTPLVELDGRAVRGNGLGLYAGDSTVRGLAVRRFRGTGIHIEGGDGNRILANHITGNAGDGVRVVRSSDNVIGGIVEGNVIAGNGRDGVSIVGTMPAGTVSLWRGDGNAADSVGANHGSFVNGATTGPGKVGAAFELDGVDDWVEFPDHPSLTPSSFTLDAWLRADDTSRSQAILTKYDSHVPNGVSWFLGMEPGGQLSWHVYESFGGGLFRGVSTNSPVMTAGVWKHVTVSFDLATQAMKIFVNGIEVAVTLAPGSSTLASVADSPTPVRIGTLFASGTVVGPVNFWDGAIDEVGVTGRVLSQAEILAIVNASGTGRRPAVNNAVRGNAIRNNAGLPIDLNDDGRTPNDPLEVFGGANRGQNFPVLESAQVVNGTVEVTVSLQSRPGRTFTLDFYAGANRRWARSIFVTTDEAGFIRLPVSLPGVSLGEAIVATATDSNGNTSEYSDVLPT
jgi:CSLREA domain-containing protein